MNYKDVSIRGNLIREVIAHFSKEYLPAGRLNKAVPERMHEPPWICPLGFQYQKIVRDHYLMEWLEPADYNGEFVILQLHGGGYIGDMRNIYRNFAVAYSEAGKGSAVLTVQYRVAPEHPYPAALQDARDAYEWLLAKGYCGARIVVAGDSAGGGLALALCMNLRDEGIELPSGIIAMSPWADQTASGESYDTNYENDPLFGRTRNSLIYNHEYAGDHDVRDPYISPLFGSFLHFPPMLIQVGSVEMLLSDSVETAKKAKKAGVKVRLSIYEGMFHVFQMGMRLLPESKQAWKEIAQFLEILQHGKICRSSTRRNQNLKNKNSSLSQSE